MSGDDFYQQLQRQKLEALGRFAGGIAHDFNNILSIIEGHTQAAVKKLKDGTLTPQALEKILVSTQRGASLTRQLLAFGQQKVAIHDKCDMRAVMLEQKILLEPLIGEMIELRMDLPKTPLWVAADDDHVVQVVLNLALNACDAMPAGGLLEITCTDAGAHAEIIVRDTGEGIAPGALGHIFDPFFTTKEPGRGTGLGLSVVYGIIDQLGGRIAVDTKKDSGTTFTVVLPKADPADQNDSALKGKGLLSLKGKTVLLAEDEPELRNILSVMLKDMELRVIEASNGNEAMQLQHEYAGTIDFLLTDVVMPEMDGLRLGKLFGVRRPDTNVIYMSGYPFLNIQKGADLPDAGAFLNKPLQEETVRQVLERALQRRDERLNAENLPKDP